MLIGRAFFGIASENLIISQSAMVSKWFRGKELSMAIGIIMTVPELASALNSFVSPLVYENTGELSYPLFISVFICVFSMICATILITLDKRADNEEKAMDIKESGEEEEPEEKVSFKDIKDFNATFWILILICTLTLGVYIPFLDDANDFYQDKFKFTAVESGRVLMIPYLISAITSPFIGTYVDKVGKRRLFIVITCSLFVISCFLFGALSAGEEEEDEETKIKTLHPNWSSLIPLTLLGLSFSSYSCVVIPSVQYVVEQRVMGTAFGLMGSLESIALAGFPLIAASIVTSAKTSEEGYSMVGYFYTGISKNLKIWSGVLGLLLSISLFFFDKQGSIILDFINPEEPTEAEKLLMKRHRRPSEESDSSSGDDEATNAESVKPRIQEEIKMLSSQKDDKQEDRTNKVINGNQEMLKMN